MNVHANSVDAHRQEKPRLSERARKILEWMRHHGPATDRDTAERMGFAHRSLVQPRITELVKAGLLNEVESKKCPVTGKTVRVVDVKRDAPKQGELFQ